MELTECVDCAEMAEDLRRLRPKVFTHEEYKMLQKGMNMLGYYMTPTSEERALLAKLNGIVQKEEERRMSDAEREQHLSAFAKGYV